MKKKAVANFLQDVKVELHKVSWPEKRFLKVITGVVLFLMIIFAIYIGVIDVIFSRIMRLFLR